MISPDWFLGSHFKEGSHWIMTLYIYIYIYILYGVGVAKKILERDVSLAGMTNDVDGTALHILAQQDISSGWKTGEGKWQADRDPRLLAEKLWDGIKELGRGRVVELMKNPPILPDAAKVGNFELITMITTSYPEILWHNAVTYRHEGVLELIKQSSTKDFHAISQFENGNNILHLAAKLLPPHGFKIFSEPDLHMKSELAWFKEVEKIVPPVFLEMRNYDGYKPKELFWKEHESMLEESTKHMKTTAESCMLVATIILTVVFAAAFTPPGGFHQETGIPLLLKNNWFASFVIFEVLASFSSTYSIITFWSIISSNYEEEQFLSSPNHLRHALSALLSSVLCAISAFLSAFFLVFGRERKALVVSFMLAVYVWLVVGVSFQFFKLFPKTNLVEYYSRRGASPGKYSFTNDSLWSRLYVAGEKIVSYSWKFIPAATPPPPPTHRHHPHRIAAAPPPPSQPRHPRRSPASCVCVISPPPPSSHLRHLAAPSPPSQPRLLCLCNLTATTPIAAQPQRLLPPPIAAQPQSNRPPTPTPSRTHRLLPPPPLPPPSQRCLLPLPPTPSPAVVLPVSQQ